MSEQKRPGGLTALAVINFLCGGVGVLGVLTTSIILVALNSIPEDSETQSVVEAWQEIGLGYFYGILALLAITTVLLIASGVGYLKQKKFLGRVLGNTYAVLSIASAMVSWFFLSEEVGGGFDIGSLIDVLYPVITLVCINIPFKHDFIRP